MYREIPRKNCSENCESIYVSTKLNNRTKLECSLLLRTKVYKLMQKSQKNIQTSNTLYRDFQVISL